MGVYLVVDRSNSMTYSGSKRDVRDGEKMRYAKQAARALIAQLDDGDHVGVIAFDSEPYVIGPLRPLGDQRVRIEDRIDRLLPGGGTDFKEALEIAGAQLAADELRVRHIILLTDGDSNRGAADHMPLVRTLASLGISVTTLRIGLDDVNLEFLQQISRITGGRFYHVRRLDELPQLLVRDAKRAEQEGVPSATEPAAPASAGRVPSLGVASEILRGFAEGDFPPVEDPVRSEPKRGADVLLSLPGEGRGLPVVASWQVGLGRAAVFALDPEAPSGAAWASWSGYGKLWSQLVRWAIREQSAGETRIAVRREGERTMLEVETFDDGGDDSIEAEIVAERARPVSLTLMPVETRVYRAPLPPLPPGRHPITLHRRRGEDVVSQRGELLEISAGSASGTRSAELARRHPDLDLLRDVAARTGGTLDPSLEDVLSRAERSRSTLDPLRWLLLPLALACLLGDVALRQRA
jgi:Ca-activated chloride channel homolog